MRVYGLTYKWQKSESDFMSALASPFLITFQFHLLMNSLSDAGHTQHLALKRLTGGLFFHAGTVVS